MRIEKSKINLNKPRFYLRGGMIIDRDAIGDPPVCRPEKEYAQDLLAVLNDKFIDHLPNKPLITGVKGERIVEEGADTRSRSEKVRSFLENLGAKTRKGNEDLIVEWEAVLKGLKDKRIQEIFANAKPGIIWPSQFLQWRNAQGSY